VKAGRLARKLAVGISGYFTFNSRWMPNFSMLLQAWCSCFLCVAKLGFPGNGVKADFALWFHWRLQFRVTGLVR
jgi:hypothetical protein